LAASLLSRLFATLPAANLVSPFSHISRGGDCAFRSRGLGDEDQANAAARVLAEFTGAVVRR